MPFSWDEANCAHLARHNVSPEEAEQVIQNDPLDLEFQLVEGEVRNLRSAKQTLDESS